jgi:hypothetical protein
MNGYDEGTDFYRGMEAVPACQDAGHRRTDQGHRTQGPIMRNPS